MSDVNLLTCLRQDLEIVWADEARQDAPAALIVNALFGGKILRFDLGVHGTHYVNLLEVDGAEEYVDLTDDMDFAWKHNLCEERTREELCANPGTFAQFRVLSNRLSALWASEVGK